MVIVDGQNTTRGPVQCLHQLGRLDIVEAHFAVQAACNELPVLELKTPHTLCCAVERSKQFPSLEVVHRDTAVVGSCCQDVVTEDVRAFL